MAKTRMVWLPDGEKISKICLFVLTWSTNVTDRRTDRRTDTACRHIPRLYIAYRAVKNIHCDQWLLSLNVTKCYHMSYSSRQSILDTSYHMQQKNYACIFQKVDYIKDLGVLFDWQLTFSEHIHQKINKAYSMLGIIKRNFIHMDPRTFMLFYC